MLKKILLKIRQFLNGPIMNHLTKIDNGDSVSQKQLALAYKSRFLDGKTLPPLWETGFKVFSQADEDGILLFLFSVIGAKSKVAVEICAGDGLECNSANLIVNHGWHALLFDGDATHVKNGQGFYRQNRLTYVAPPRFINAWITKENVNQLIEDNGIKGEVDLLSVDMDGVDYWILKEITVIRPRVVVVEYNYILGPEKRLTVPYQDNFDGWAGPNTNGAPNYYGASLPAFQQLLSERGYRLVGCNQYGFNAFFVRNDLAAEAIPACDIETCFSHPNIASETKERFATVADHPWVKV